MFGNTEKIANSLGKGLSEVGVETRTVNIKLVNVQELVSYDLLVIGAPTQYFSASKSMKQFLEQIQRLNLKGRQGFAFDTRLDSRFSGSATKFIQKKLEEIGVEMIKPRESAIVIGQKAKDAQAGGATLKEGMENRFESIGKDLGNLLQKVAKVRIA